MASPRWSEGARDEAAWGCRFCEEGIWGAPDLGAGVEEVRSDEHYYAFDRSFVRLRAYLTTHSPLHTELIKRLGTNTAKNKNCLKVLGFILTLASMKTVRDTTETNDNSLIGYLRIHTDTNVIISDQTICVIFLH